MASSMEQARIIDARAAALRSRVEELAMASFRDRTSNLAGKTRSHHLTIPSQGKVVRAEHGTIVAPTRARTRHAPGVLLANSAAPISSTVLLPPRRRARVQRSSTYTSSGRC